MRIRYGSGDVCSSELVLEFNGDVEPDSVLAHSRCLGEGLGEAVPVRLISGQARQDILKAVYYSMSEQWNTPSTQLLQCKRRLPAQARVRLSIGPGVTTALAPGRPAVANEKAKVRSEEHTSELQSLMRISYADFCLTKK